MLQNQRNTWSNDGHVAVITLQRPEQANRLDPDDLQCIEEYLHAVNDNPEIRVLRFEATGKYFCSGFDTKQLGGDRLVDFDTVVDLVENARPVTIAVIHGGIDGGATDLAPLAMLGMKKHLSSIHKANSTVLI